MAATETWVLDGVALMGGNFDILELNADPPKARAEWITAADSESAALTRQPLHENRTITMKLRVAAQASMNAALDQVGAIRDKLRLASATPDGKALTWTPANSTRTVTFDVLNGEIPELPIGLSDQAWSWFKQRPIFTLELTCKPYWRGTETLSSTASTSTPITTIEITGTAGDIPALGRLIVTDTATQNRRYVEWGLENQFYNSATSLIVDSDNMVTTGFTGTQTTRSGSYDPNASGNNVIRAAQVLTTPLAICGTGNLAHVGTFRVWARVFAATGDQFVRLSWRAGDGQYAVNQWVAGAVAGTTNYWAELDLGLITIPTAISGTQQWDGRIEAFHNAVGATPLALDIDYLLLVPVAEGSGAAKSSFQVVPGATVAYDSFTGITTGTALNARVAPLGGTWATSGATTDFTAADLPAGFETETRSTLSDSGVGRFAILGATSYTDVDVTVAVNVGQPTIAGAVLQSAVARFVDSSNYLLCTLVRSDTAGYFLELHQVVAGVDTTLASRRLYGATPAPFTWNNVRLVAYATGRIVGMLQASGGAVAAQVEAYSTATATGGALATGKPGFLDKNATGTAYNRYYEDFSVATPMAESVALFSGRTIEFRYDDTIRQNSAGTVYGRPPSYRGSRFTVPPGTSRIAVKARRVDVTTSQVDNVTDATQIQVGTTPRGLVVPRV